ncbi:MAG: hypothetical protein VKP62_10535 [Candidatus Sericytochromatia bacterium]|nr:hypothetical protein [Candidatus Sericytochromatia bacterium]
MHRPSVNEESWFREQEARRQQDRRAEVEHRREVEERKRLGEYLLEKGYITLLNLEAALQRQQHLASRGRRVVLGELLIEMNLVRGPQVQEALLHQRQALTDGAAYVEIRR